MPEAGRLRGVYNIVKQGEYEAVDYQMPVREFYKKLKNDDVPDEVAVVGLEDAFEDEEFIGKLSRVMDRKADDLENRDQSPMIQFVVDADIHRGKFAPDLFYENELYSLQKVFGRQIDRKSDSWYTAPF